MRYNDAIEPYTMQRVQPLTFSLDNPYPNPFNPTTKIDYTIANNVNELSIKIYDIQGRLVKTLHKGSQEYGHHQLVWNASMHASGIYFIQMNTENYSSVKKLVLIK